MEVHSSMFDPTDGFLGERADMRTVDEARHFYFCLACGQLVDKRDLAAIFHHEELGHEPLAIEDATRLFRIAGLLTAALRERDSH